MKIRMTVQTVVLAVCVLTVVLWKAHSGSAQPGAGTQPRAGASHPLDPLNADEITRAAALVKADSRFPAGGLLPTIDLQEPEKAAVLAYRPGSGASIPRQAFLVVFDRPGDRVFEAVVDLTAGRIASWKSVERVQPIMMLGEDDEVTALIRTDARWQDAMRKRGITDLDKVAVDVWAAGPEPGARRVFRALFFYRGEGANAYSRPIEGVVALVDLTRGRVLDVTDTGVVPIAGRTLDLDAKSIGRQRPALPPILVTQPQGPGFVVEGHQVRWEGWRFRYGMSPQEGLVLNQIQYDGPDGPRSILYRAAISEMIVPYGDPDDNWNWRSAFDVGEYGFGLGCTPLGPGLDVPGYARFFDAVVADRTGKPHNRPRSVGIYEQDAGVLWKHFDINTGTNHIRRGRQLVVCTSVVVGNYDYMLRWIFHQDGTLELDAGLTGMLLAKGTTMTKDPKELTCGGCTSHLVGEHLLAPNHQHFFNYRLDFDIDGPKNSLLEMNFGSMPRGSSNRAGNGFVMRETLLPRESQAQRDMDFATQRAWRVVNPGVRNSLGNPSGYMLVPSGNSPPYALTGSEPRTRATFLSHHIWGTRYRPNELYAAGRYPHLSEKDTGLSIWTRDNETIHNEDLVLWYTMGVTHGPREEEWPIMNTHHVGFKLMPAGFFASNPAMDVPGR